jgi:transcriptional regulator with XRE-family HTH domain
MGKPPARREIRRAFANTVRVLRRKAGIAQEQLALNAGIDRTYMSALEREIHSPTLETVYKLLPHLGVTFAEFAKVFERHLKSGK